MHYYSITNRIETTIIFQKLKNNHFQTSAKEVKVMSKLNNMIYWFISLRQQLTFVTISLYNFNNVFMKLCLTVRYFVVSDLRSETKGSRFESGCQLCAEVRSLQ